MAIVRKKFKIIKAASCTRITIRLFCVKPLNLSITNMPLTARAGVAFSAISYVCCRVKFTHKIKLSRVDTGCANSRERLPSGRMTTLLVDNPQLTPMLKPTHEDTHSCKTEES